MNRPMLLVAVREFRQIAATRSFWITLLILPVALAIGPLASHFMEKPHTQTLMLIDRSGQAAPAIAERLELDHQRAVLNALSDYSERHGLDRVDPSAPWARHDAYYSDAEVATFIRSGGAARALASMRSAARSDTTPFKTPEPDYRIVPLPAELAAADLATLDRVMPRMIDPPARADRLDYAVYVPADLAGGRAAVRVWSDGQPSWGLMTALRETLTRTMRLGFLVQHGLNPQVAAVAGELAPVIQVRTPPPGKGQEQMIIRSILPLLFGTNNPALAGGTSN